MSKNFELNDDEEKRANEWIEIQKYYYPSNSTAIGGRFYFRFTPTGVGTFIHIYDCVTETELDLTADVNW